MFAILEKAACSLIKNLFSYVYYIINCLSPCTEIFFVNTISWLLQLLREISQENVVKLVNVHINHADMSLYLAFDYADHDLYVRATISYVARCSFNYMYLCS